MITCTREFFIFTMIFLSYLLSIFILGVMKLYQDSNPISKFIHEYYYSLILIITFIYSFLLSTKYCSLLISIKEIPDMKKKLAELEQLQVFRQLYNRLKTGIVNIMIGPNQKDKEQSYEELRALLNVNPLGHSPSLSRYP